MTDTERWNINESLLQSYRSIFISSQSFFLAIGALVVAENFYVLAMIALISIIQIWVIWFPVVRARHLLVDYYKYRSLNGDTEGLCTEDEYVHKKGLRNEANNLLGIRKNWRPTRCKIDLVKPILFSSVWVILVIYGFYNKT